MANKMNPDGSFGNRWGDTPTPHSTQEEHAFLWLERELKNGCNGGRYGCEVHMTRGQRDRLLAAIKTWREAGNG